MGIIGEYRAGDFIRVAVVALAVAKIICGGGVGATFCPAGAGTVATIVDLREDNGVIDLGLAAMGGKHGAE